MSLFRQLFRGAWAVSVLAAGTVEVLVKRPRTRAERAAWLCAMCRRLLRAFHVRVSVGGPVPAGGAVVSNHLSFLDIFSMGSLRPSVFVSKAELRQTPVIGWMSMMSGTVYVTRGAGGSAAKAAEDMAQGFHDGLPVIFFPEGGTSYGDEPAQPFRSGLIAESIEAGATITPGFIAYELAPADLQRGFTLREDIHWGNQSLATLVWRLLGLEYVKVHIQFAQGPVDFSDSARNDRKIAAEEARNAVLMVHTKRT